MEDFRKGMAGVSAVAARIEGGVWGGCVALSTAAVGSWRGCAPLQKLFELFNLEIALFDCVFKVCIPSCTCRFCASTATCYVLTTT